MSRVVAPFGLQFDADRVPADARWWYLSLTGRRNADGQFLVVRSDAESGQSWVSLEFFDGHDVVLDAGLDRPTVFGVVAKSVDPGIKVLSVGQPTPCPDWVLLDRQAS